MKSSTGNFLSMKRARKLKKSKNNSRRETNLPTRWLTSSFSKTSKTSSLRQLRIEKTEMVQWHLKIWQQLVCARFESKKFALCYRKLCLKNYSIYFKQTFIISNFGVGFLVNAWFTFVYLSLCKIVIVTWVEFLIK